MKEAKAEEGEENNFPIELYQLANSASSTQRKAETAIVVSASEIQTKASSNGVARNDSSSRMYSPASQRRFGAGSKNSPRKQIHSPSDRTPFRFVSKLIMFVDKDAVSKHV